MVTKLMRPRDATEALAMLASEGGSIPLAGGTYLLASRFKDRPMALVSVSGILPAAMERERGGLRLGAGVTFQELVDSPIAPEALKEAALCMANRNVRNRATVGGNLGANKACGSLPPLFIAAGASVRLAGGRGEMPAEAWLGLADDAPRALLESVFLPLPPGRSIAYRRWARTACDLSVLAAAVSMDRPPASAAAPIAGLRIAMGGLGPRARRFPELEALFEGRALTSLDEAEAAIAPLLSPIGDARGSADFKRLRAAALLAETITAAASPAAGGEAGGRS